VTQADITPESALHGPVRRIEGSQVMNEPHDPNVTSDLASAAADSAAAAEALRTTDHVRASASTDGSHPPADATAIDLPAVPGYRVLREIARGGMGRVLGAYDLTLDRDVALKVLLPGANADRFVRESKITARLPHPGVPPVHALGTLADGSPFLAMKLIAGRTLADEMKSADRPRLLQAFLQVCQAVGFAHSRGIIHRDLKPGNVMVGAFGEVQVMDWGLAKLLASQEREGDGQLSAAPCVSVGSADPGATTAHRGAGEATDEQTQAGQVLGTPAYMAPEQARGETTDARSDVFALGGILCVILTGQPPFGGKSTLEVVRRAGAADLTEANARLDRCGADAELIGLCRRCLSPSPADRPADGQAVADEMTAYLDGVQDRLRQAELAQAEARAKAAEEAKRRRLTLALAATVLLAVLLGGGGWLYVKGERDARERVQARRQVELAQEVNDALSKATTLREKAKSAKVGGAALFAQAREQAQRARALVENGPADETLAGRVRQLMAELDDEEKDRTLVAALDQARLEQTATLSQNRFAHERAVPKFQEAFRVYGLPAGECDREAAAQRIRQRPPEVREAILAALEEWDDLASQPNLRINEPHRDWLRAVREAVESEDAWTRNVKLLMRETDREKQRTALAALARSLDVKSVSPRRLIRLAKSLGSPGGTDLLRRAQRQYPNDFWINEELGVVLAKTTPPAWEEATRFATVAVALRPDSPGALVNLGFTLKRQDQSNEAIACYKKAIAIDSKYVTAYYNLGTALRETGELDEAISWFRKAIALDPNGAHIYHNLADTLQAKGEMEEAIACYKKAIAIDPTSAKSHNDLGVVLKQTRQYEQAITSFRKAIENDPTMAMAHYNLGQTLSRLGREEEAIAGFKKAIELNPDDASTHHKLGFSLSQLGRIDEAITSYRKSIELDPKDASVHHNLGAVLFRKKQVDQAITCYKKALELDPKAVSSHNDLGVALSVKGRFDKAIPHFRKAIELDPKHFNAYGALGMALYMKGRFVEARDATARALKIIPEQHPKRRMLGEQLQEFEQFAKLEARLPRLLEGKDKAVSAQESLALAEMCHRKQMNATAARFSADALAADPKLAADLKAGHRYNAACYAVLGASGQGGDADKLNDKEKVRLRKLALDWLRADLAARTKQLEGGLPADRAEGRRQLLHWQEDSDLAGIRDKAALEKLPPDEQKAFTQLWADVAALLKKAEDKPK
jgi:tetratricopeptide (TPR) repeat protein/serine/threonine protein kinase